MTAHRVKIDFDEVVRQTHTRIRAYIAGMGIASHEVDDLAQEVYLQLYRGGCQVPAGIAPERWLKGIARNLCLNHIRRTSRRARLQREALAELLARAKTDEFESAHEESLQWALDGCFSKLPAKSRRMLMLRYHSDLAAAKIADAVHSSPEAVRIALFRIRAALRDCITRSLAHQRWP